MLSMVHARNPLLFRGIRVGPVAPGSGSITGAGAACDPGANGTKYAEIVS